MPAPQRRAPRIPTAPAEAQNAKPTFIAPTPAGQQTTDHKATPVNQPQAAEDELSSVARRPSSDDILQQPLWEALQEMDNANGDTAENDDDLLPEAIALVRSLNKASTSLLQRRFRIGYTRSARLMDALEEQGIIGPPTGTSKAREVYGGSANDELRSTNEEEPPTTDH